MKKNKRLLGIILDMMKKITDIYPKTYTIIYQGRITVGRIQK